MLPNPYRLIIDIHGKDGRTRQRKDTGENSSAERALGSALKSTDELDSHASENDVTAFARAATAESAKALGTDPEVSKASMTTGPEVSSRSKKTGSEVVKKIIDADDTDEASAAVPALDSAKRSVRPAQQESITQRNVIATKKVVDNDLSDQSEGLDSSLAQSGGGDPTNSRNRTTARTLASGRSASASDLGTREAKPTAAGERSLIRALGLKIGKIVIDPGHGGHDTGTIGPNGLEEKDLVLDVSRRLGRLLETRLGAEVVYTRKDDTFIPLETRTAIANQARADLFVSIHANSSRDSAARGVETYYLNFTSSSEALEVAARENAVSEKSIYELQDLVKKIALKEKIEESREFAGDVQASLHSGLAVKSPAIRDRGVKKAPFIVLIGANMPSILAEISFVSNPTDEHRLASSEYRERIAESLYRGIAKYANGLSGVKVASKMDKGAGQ